MQATGRTQAELQAQRKKLTNSYKALLDEFNSKDLQTVGNYTLGRLIGKGSFGKVYLASHKLTNGSKVVLKSAKKDDANLAREIHHHRQFLHPHIARLYEVIVTENLVWLVLEYCPGDELYTYLTKKGALDPPKVQKIFTQLVGAVSYVHSKSCVHRDLKLENILLDKHGNVKLVDFGFTREYEGKSNYLQTWCGTVCYSAPEMIRGEKYAGEKVDVWSLGIILYALLAGELPFDDDDENVTKARILKEEPTYPDHFPEGATNLIKQLLSKRPILRPTLADILQHPWLAEHAPQQQVILKLQQPAPFSTPLEKETLQRMHSAGVDIDMVIENVLAQRCDSLAGWWALLIEKEERKAKRRERKRREKEAEAKSIRRLSAASSRLDRLAPTIKEMDEEGHSMDPPRSRGRPTKRNSAGLSDLPRLPEASITPESEHRPPPVEKDVARSASPSRGRPPLPPKEIRRSRSSMLQVVSSNPDLLAPNGFVSKRNNRYKQPLLNQLAALKHWFKESAKRARSPHSRHAKSVSPKASQKASASSETRRKSSTGVSSRGHSSSAARPDIQRPAYPTRPRVSTGGSASLKRPSLSPSPITPHSSYYRRSSHGLRGRKSTSSSVSSVRSIHHVHTHSKASSTSSTSIASPPSISSKNRSPHGSSTIKVLPATPTGSTFPSSIRISRTPLFSESAAAFGQMAPPSPGLVFAKRKRSPFKGPMLNLNPPGGGSSPGGAGHRREASHSRSASQPGRRSGEAIIQEEDEEDLYEMEDGMLVEEVEQFSPLTGPGEVVVLEEQEESDGGVGPGVGGPKTPTRKR